MIILSRWDAEWFNESPQSGQCSRISSLTAVISFSPGRFRVVPGCPPFLPDFFFRFEVSFLMNAGFDPDGAAGEKGAK